MRLAFGMVLALSGVLVAAPVSAATYYASPSGTGTTCSLAAPCTISQCVSRISANGDVCSVGDGIYTDPPGASLARNCGTGTGVCTVKSTNKHGARIDRTSGAADTFTVTGDNWVVDGFLVRAQSDGNFTQVNSGADGFTWSNNRVEVKPGTQSIVLWATGSNNLVVRGNWVHHYPHCINGGETYPAGPWGAGATAPDCGTHSRCDFDTTTSADAINIQGDGRSTATSGLLFEQNDFGHWQNPVRIRNFVNVTIRKNICTNATNHGCWEMDDVKSVVIENNIADIDTGAGCGDEILQSSLFDSYCYSDVVIRNNTSVGHALGWQQQIAFLAPNAGADQRCNDGVLPEVGDDGTWYDYFRVYNNIVYDGKPSGSVGITLKPGFAAAEPSPCCYSNYNLINRPSGGYYGQMDNTKYSTFAQWQAQGKDLNGRDVAPQFVSYAGHNYRPGTQTAPQVNTGQNTGAYPCPAEDYDGNPRPVGGACDIGAFEFQGGTAPTPPGTVSNLNRTDAK